MTQAFEKSKIEVIKSLIHMNSDIPHISKYSGNDTLCLAIRVQQPTEVLQLLLDNTPDYESYLNRGLFILDGHLITNPGYMKMRNEGANYLESSCILGNPDAIKMFTELGLELEPGLDCDQLRQDWFDDLRRYTNKWFY